MVLGLAVQVVVLVATLVTLFRKDYILSWLTFNFWDDDLLVAVVEFDDRHVNVDDQDLDDWEGITLHELRTVDADSDDAGETQADGGTADELPVLDLCSGQYELLFLLLRYDGYVMFKPLVWWVHFWPPENVRIVPDDAEDDLPGVEVTSYANDAALLDTGDDGPPSTDYDNLAYRPTADKRIHPIRRSSARLQLDHYTSNHNVFMPIWVYVPDEFAYVDWMEDRTPRLTVVVDPPNLPVTIEKRIDIESTDCEHG
ncbi:hypothetical protein ACFQJD_12980 [Haloplanus sp. GCM10025708]|uniref:hypothetical protein n=1 Tax=Haloferacaceae TaxID=1644056 RepID=UPI003608166F